MTLDQAKPGDRFRIESVQGTPDLVQRLTELGFLEGEEIEVLNLAPLGDPMEIEVGFTRLSLRKREAAGVRLLPR